MRKDYKDSEYEEAIEDNMVAPIQAPMTKWVGLGLLCLAAVLYLVTFSVGAFPGLPSRSLVMALQLDSFGSPLDFLWRKMVYGLSLLPGPITTAVWANVLSLVFSLATLHLFYVLMIRVRYSFDSDRSRYFQKEKASRCVAAAIGTLYLMVAIPFWILSTRSLPGTFHLFLLLLAAWFYSEYQRTGRPLNLYLFAGIYGVGVPEFATFIIFAPFAGFMLIRAMVQRGVFRWAFVIKVALCALPGFLLLYGLSALEYAGTLGAELRGNTVFWKSLLFILKNQWNLIIHATHTGGMVVVLMLTVLPWALVFLLSRRDPMHRNWGQFLVRFVMVGVFLASLFPSKFTPWDLGGQMRYLMTTPYLIMAICIGYVAGDFWMGALSRFWSKFVPIVILIALIVSAGFNFQSVDGKTSRVSNYMVEQILDGIGNRDVLLSSGIVDYQILLGAHERGQDIRVINLRDANSAFYRRYLQAIFDNPRLQGLLSVSFPGFLREWLSDDESLLRTACMDSAELLREYAYLEPDRLVYRLHLNEEDIRIDELIADQRPFWARMEALQKQSFSADNPGTPFNRYFLQMASKAANNIGFMQMERDDQNGAWETFQHAKNIYPDNISALINLLTLAYEQERPEKAELDAEMTVFKERNPNPRVLWTLNSAFGYVYNPEFMARSGLMWAVSGKPRMAEAELRRASKGQSEESAALKTFLGRAYMRGGDVERSRQFYGEILESNPDNIEALLNLSRIALSMADFDTANLYLKKLVELGVPPERLLFEKALEAMLQGKTQQGIRMLKTVVKNNKDDLRAWAILAMVTSDGSDPEANQQAIAALQAKKNAEPEIRLMLAELLMRQKDYPAARTEVEQILRQNPRNTMALEMLVNIDFAERKRDLAEDHVRVLLTLDPGNFTANVMLGSFQYERGEYSLAEASYRAALRNRREPPVLNDLAYVLLLKGQTAEALELIEEALLKQPNNPLMRSTRGEIHLALKQLDEAEKDLQVALEAFPNHAPFLLDMAQLFELRGQKDEARNLVDDLKGRLSELSKELQETLAALDRRLRNN